MSSGAQPCGDVLQEIIGRISLHKDILCCAAVCKQWGSIVMDNLHRLPHSLPLSYCLRRSHQLPLLMHFNDEVGGKIKFLSVLDNKSFTDYLVPEITGKWITASSNGCLVLSGLLDKKILILNPLTRAQISLPSLFTFKSFCSHGRNLDKLTFIRKAIIISEHGSRNLEGCIVIAIVSYLRALSFCRPGDYKWTTIKACRRRITDVIYFKGQLYAVYLQGALVNFDIEHQVVKLVAGHGNNGFKFANVKEYLVGSTCGDLLLVVRDYGSSTTKFSVYRLEEVDETLIEISLGNYLAMRVVKYLWVKLKSLDDQILFVGQNCKCVPASLYPDLKGNCIYFTDEDLCYKHVRAAVSRARHEDFEGYKIEKHDMGIYDMEEKSIQPIGFMDDKFSRVPAIWVEPNFG